VFQIVRVRPRTYVEPTLKTVWRRKSDTRPLRQGHNSRLIWQKSKTVHCCVRIAAFDDIGCFEGVEEEALGVLCMWIFSSPKDSEVVGGQELNAVETGVAGGRR